MTANLVLHWHLDALTPENRALDSSDNHLNGVVAGDPANQPDERFGSVLRIAQSADVITVPDAPALRLAGYTVEVWINAAAPPTAQAAVVAKLPNDLRLILGADSSVSHRFTTTTNTDDGHTTAPLAVAPGGWHHVAIVNDGHSASIVVDGKRVSTYAFTGQRLAVPGPLRVGSGGTAGAFRGSLAHLRIYDGPLTDAEIQQDMADDESALAAFVRAHPIDFALLDVDEQPVLFIDDAPGGQPMTLRLTNTSRQDLEPQPIVGSPASAADHIFALHFRPGTLAIPPQPTVATPGWSILAETDPETGGTVLYLASVDPPAIARGASYDIELGGLNADGTGGTRGTRVELTYHRLRYAGEADELVGQRIAFLDLVNHRGRREIPLAVGFVGGNRVLSDGVTPNTLRIRVGNLSRDKALSLKGASFTLSYDVQEANETHEWALSDAGQAGRAVLGGLQADKVGANWTITQANLGQRVEWTLTPQGETEFAPDGSFTVTLSQIYALSSLGQAAIVIGYQNIPGYQDGSATLVAEKSPLMFSGASVGIGTNAPQAKLNIINADQDPNGNTLILGPTNASNLRLGYNTEYSWIQSHGARPLAVNAIGNNVTIGTSAPNGAKVAVSADSSHLQLRREPNARAGKQLYLELFQDNTPNPVYPSLRFHHANVFWHRIEARPEGLMFKTGDLNNDSLVDVFAHTATLSQVANGASPGAQLDVDTAARHLRVTRQPGSPDTVGGKTLYLELYQDNRSVPTYPSLRFHHANVFWHRIEARPEGLMFKTGDLNNDGFVDLYANTAIVNALRIGGITIGANELRVLQELAAGRLQFDLWNVVQNEYLYAADYAPFDDDRRRVFTWRRKGERVNQGRWQISFPS